MHLICTSGYALLRPVDQVVMHSSLWSRGLRFKSAWSNQNTALPAALYRCDISFKAAMLLGCDDAVVGPANFMRFDVLQHV